MSNTIAADKAKVLKAHRLGNTRTKKKLETIFGKEVFEPKDICDRIHGFRDVLELTDPDKEIREFIGYDGKNALILGAVAFAKAQLIAEAYNEGETPDAQKEGVKIYFPVFKRPELGFSDSNFVYWYSYSFAGARLGFKKLELSSDAGIKFGDIYRQLILKK